MNSSAVEHLILEGSAATDLRLGYGRFCSSFFCGLSENAVVNELLKLDNVWPSHCQKCAIFMAYSVHCTFTQQLELHLH